MVNDAEEEEGAVEHYCGVLNCEFQATRTDGRTDARSLSMDWNATFGIVEIIIIKATEKTKTKKKKKRWMRWKMYIFTVASFYLAGSFPAATAMTDRLPDGVTD